MGGWQLEITHPIYTFADILLLETMDERQGLKPKGISGISSLGNSSISKIFGPSQFCWLTTYTLKDQKPVGDSPYQITERGWFALRCNSTN